MMVKELNVMTENRQELKLKVSEMVREMKEKEARIEHVEGEKE